MVFGLAHYVSEHVFWILILMILHDLKPGSLLELLESSYLNGCINPDGDIDYTLGDVWAQKGSIFLFLYVYDKTFPKCRDFQNDACVFLYKDKCIAIPWTFDSQSYFRFLQ